MKVLVLGARGRLGCVLVPHLEASGHRVLRHSRSPGSDVAVDLLDQAGVDAALDRVVPDAIINLAALTDVDECERNPQSAYRSNVRIVENIAAWIRRTGHPCRLVQLSTDQVYDGPGPHEESDVTITNYYGLSKYAGELAALTAPSVVLRTNFFGPSEHDSGKSSFSDWLVRSFREGRSITVFENVLFTPLSMRRVAELVELVLRAQHSGVYNLGSKAGMSKADFAFLLADVLGLPTSAVTRGTADSAHLRAHRPQDMRMDSARFKATFGVTLPTLQSEIISMKQAYADLLK
jgi:dTDP-4-dehydrorhamnose reductase